MATNKRKRKSSPNISGRSRDQPTRRKIVRDNSSGRGISKKEFDRLKSAARIVPYWLLDEPEALKWTLNELKIKQLMKDSEEYSTIYVESVSSFHQELQNQLKQLLLSNTEVDIKDEEQLFILHSLIKRLVDVGLNDLQCAKKFKQLRAHNGKISDMHKRVNRKKRLLLERELKFRLAQQRLDDYMNSNPEYEKNEGRGNVVPNAHGNGAKKQSSVSLKPSIWESIVATAIEHMPPFLLRSSSTLTKDDMVKGEVQNWKETIQARNEGDTELLRLKRKVQLSRNLLKSTNVQIQQLELQAEEVEANFNYGEYQRLSAVVKSVMRELCPRLANHMSNRYKHLLKQYQILDSKTDLTKPHEWYLFARLDRRKIIFHGGPTNSGKTFQALERLKEARRGVYVGPLRLLAVEIYEMLNAQGVPTNLLTGQEKQIMPFSTHVAATIEMAPMDEKFDIVVIDEIQMIGDSSRGYAWTRALFGIRCKEIHVCGGMEASHLIEKIAKMCGDDFELRKYERFTKLSIADASLSPTVDSHGCYENVKPGDCVVAFSRADIFSIKREIESSTNYKCCVVYGSLPPETRAEQARLFNNPNSGYDILVASDAIGMGLNLSIRRIIFNSIFKSNGEEIVQLSHSAVKQIAGRAGRRNSPFPHGEVTVRDPRDLKYLRWCLTTDVSPISKAGLLPTPSHIKLFSDAIQEYQMEIDGNIYEILKKFATMATLDGDFFLCRQKSMEIIAKQLTDLPLDISDKYTLCMAPISFNNKESISTLRSFAKKQSLGRLSGLDRKHVPKPASSFEEFSKLCSIHSDIELFLWLLRRFPGNYVEEQTALSLQGRSVELIDRGLASTDRLELNHCHVSRDDRLRKVVRKKDSLMEDDIPDI